jgi:hypothetical protein
MYGILKFGRVASASVHEGIERFVAARLLTPTQQSMIWGKLTAILTHQVAENIS